MYESSSGERLFEFDTLYDEEDAVPEQIPTEEKSILRAKRRKRKAVCDTMIVPAQEEGFQRVFIGEDRWHAVRIGAAMKDRLRYIAAYRVAPISGVTHIAEIQDIRPWEDSGKYVVTFKGPAKEIETVPVAESKNSPQSGCYVRREDLERAKNLEECLKLDL